ncbi:MAG: type II secretion system protein [Synergistaceae bacterium]|nr:type II secretion system protein [Synergistaceae bacterium]
MTLSRKKRGFTLFELLIVIVVIGILTAGMFIAASEMEATARAAQIINDLRMLKVASEHWFFDNSLNIVEAPSNASDKGYHLRINGKDERLHDVLQSDAYGVKNYISNPNFALNTGKKDDWKNMYAAVGGYSVYVGFSNTVCYVACRISGDDKKRDYSRLREKLKGKTKSAGLVFYDYNGGNQRETAYNGENFVCMRSFVLDDSKLKTK